MKKRPLLSLLLLSILSANLANISVCAKTPDIMRGVWLWGATVREMGKDGAVSVVRDLEKHGFTDIFLMVKGASGVVGYPSKVALSVVKSEQDPLPEIIAAAHKKKIKVHAWYVINQDKVWAEKHPEEVMVHLKNGPLKDGRISPLAPGYQNYIKEQVREIIDNYQVDGVHLDYIRYPHAVYSFDKYTFAEAEKRGIDVEQVKNILNQTFYNPGDNSIVMKAYENGDPAIIGWEKLRRDIIGQFAQEIGEIVKSAKRPLAYSAALMPEGAYNPNYGDVHYGQNYRDSGAIYDFVVPMAYWKSFSQPPRWVGSVVVKEATAFLGKTSVYAGLQAFEVSGNKEMADAEAAALENGSRGVVLFRYGTFVFASVQVKKKFSGKTSVTFKLQNRTDSNIDNIEIDFEGTGLVPKKGLRIPKGASSEVNANKIALTGAQLLNLNQEFEFSVEVVKAPASKVSAKMPSIKLSRQKRSFYPVYTVVK